MLQIQQELRQEFNVKLAIPSKPKARPKKPAPVPARQPEKAAIGSPQTISLEKRLAAQKRKLEDAVRAGKPEKPLRDRIYELEDELRLAKEK